MSDPWLHCVFCDDIRYEHGGKFSLIGIYAGDMMIGTIVFPAVLPRLVTQIWITIPRDRPLSSVIVEIIGARGEELARVEPPDLPSAAEIPEGAERLTVGLSVVQSPFVISAEGRIEAWVTIDGIRQKAGQIGVWRSPPAPPMA